MGTLFYFTGLLFWLSFGTFFLIFSISWLLHTIKKTAIYKYLIRWYEWYFKRQKVMRMYSSANEVNRATIRGWLHKTEHPTSPLWLGLYETAEINLPPKGGLVWTVQPDGTKHTQHVGPFKTNWQFKVAPFAGSKWTLEISVDVDNTSDQDADFDSEELAMQAAEKFIQDL